MTPSGWYPDASNPGHLRYFDGSEWTAHRRPEGASQASPNADSDESPATSTSQPGSRLRRLAAATISNWTLIAATLLVVSTLLGRVYARAYLGELGLREDEIGLNDQSLVEMVRSGAGLFLGFTLYVALATAGISAILLGPVLVVIEVVHRVFANRWWTFGSMVRNRGVRLIVSLLLAGVVAFMSLIVVAGPKSAASDVAIGRLEQDSFSSWTFWFMFPHKPRCVVLVGPDETMNTESDSGPPLVWLGDHDGYTTLLRASDGAGRPKIARVPSGSFALVAQADEPCR